MHTGKKPANEALALDRLVPPYLNELATFLQTHMPDAWQWMHSDRFARVDVESIRLELLRTTVRIDRAKNERVYSLVDKVAETLQLNIPVTLYQVQNPNGWNAAAMSIPDHADLLIEGPLLTEFSDQELTAVLAHELGHVVLWQVDDCRHHTTLLLLDALCNDANAADAHIQSDRLRRLYTEIFCDRVASTVLGDPLPAIASLIKVGTQASEVDPDSYLNQADEIFATGSVKSDQVTHPELFIRARSLKLWADSSDEVHAKVDSMIGRDAQLDQMDLLQREKISRLTQRTLDAMLRHDWFRSDASLAHACQFFEQYQWTKILNKDLKSLAWRISKLDPTVQQYFAYLLLDFATTDRELDVLPLAAAMECAERFSISDVFRDIARKELKMRVKQWDELDNSKHDLLAKADKK
ncbi:M48 family metalloprotease [Neorhodopirellula lusitana]|uniref:M48 family metalloprotease n=1 Tax=Neorhodopirellula lusitana TaxID=445327 RepID=UPI00384D80AF